MSFVDQVIRKIETEEEMLYGLFTNFFNEFCNVGGLEAVLKIVLVKQVPGLRECKLPLEAIMNVLVPFKAIRGIISEEVREELVNTIKTILSQQIESLDDKNMKDANKGVMAKFMNLMKKILKTLSDGKEVSKIIRDYEMTMSLKFVQSSSLEKRLNGVDNIRRLISNVDSFNKFSYHNAMTYQRISTRSSDEWFNINYLSNWMIEQKVLESILNENAHPELIRRCTQILIFLADKKLITIEMLDLLWNCQHDKHEDIVLAIYDTIKECVEHLSIDHLKYIYTKIKLIPIDKYNEILLTFMKDFTIKAYDTQGQDLNDDIKSLDELNPERNQDVIAIPNNEALFCLPIFWTLLQDDSPLSLELTELANNMFKECVSNIPLIKPKLQYLYLCMENLSINKSVPQSCSNSLNIIDLFGKNKMLVQALLPKLLKDYNTAKIILNSFEQYFKIIAEKFDIYKLIEEDDISNRIFVGKYNHSLNLDWRMKFLCDMEDYAPKEYKLTNEHIQSLWSVFMEIPHPKFDVKNFLGWIISEREVSGKAMLVATFENEQMCYLFELLCKDRERLCKDYGLIYFSCFITNFMIVNISKHYLEMTKTKIKTVDINHLVGLDAIWDIISFCNNENVREKFNECLINLYTNLSDDLQEKYMDIVSKLIIRCMNIIVKTDPLDGERTITNIVKLLLQFFYLFDETKFKSQGNKDSKCYTQSIIVTLEPKGISIKFEVGTDILVGELRKKISEAFEIPFSGFSMRSKSDVYERQDDNLAFRDIGWCKQIQVKCFSKEGGNPKLLIANNNSYINHLFLLLSKESASYVESVWELLITLPRNEEMMSKINSLALSSNGKCNWDDLLDTKSIHKFLYVLQIIETIVTPPTNTDSVEAGMNYKRWISSFSKKEGLKHLFHAFLSLPIDSLHHPLTRKSFGLLLKVLNHIQMANYLLIDYVSNYQNYYQSMIERILIILNSFAQFSILNEEEKQLRMLQMQRSPKRDEEFLSKEVMASQKQHKDQQEESKIFDYAFTILAKSQKENYNYFNEMSKFPLFKELLLKGLILSDNQVLRETFAIKLLLMCEQLPNNELTPNPYPLLASYLLQLIGNTLSHTFNCQEFYKILSTLLKSIPIEVLDKMSDIQELLLMITNYIKQRQVIERTSKDTDNVLIGLLSILNCLLVKFPSGRVFVGQSCGIIDEILLKCLFEFPAMTERRQIPPPKCKSDESRQAAFYLLQTLSKDCPVNLTHTLQFLTPIHVKGAWRTKRDHDWNIMGESNEKSTTGYVGLKNLGCTCYMNSLLQQFYMIPTFRNSILAIENAKRDASQEDDLLYQTQYLFAELHESAKQYYDTKVFCHSVKNYENKPINTYEQMDVDEFFSLFLDKLEFAMKGTPQEQTIKKHFGGIFANQLLCKDCPHSRVLEEPFLALNLQVKNKKSLEKCLESFVEGEMLQGDNAYHCEKCDKKVTTLKRVCIKRLPRYLIFVLKRFDINYDTMQRFKIDDYCEFPSLLNMEAFTAESLAKKDQEKQREKAMKEGQDLDEIPVNSSSDTQYPPEYYQYKLTGVIIHVGTADTGHYYSLIVDREKERWFEFNDTIVEPYDPEGIKEDAFGGERKTQLLDGVTFRITEKSLNAYLLVYDRISSYEPPEENSEDESNKKISELSTSSITIPESIHSAIIQENMKYWYSRYIFHNHYFEFALNLCENWNSKENILQLYPCRNNDYSLLGFSKKVFLTHAFKEPKTELPISKLNNEEIEIQIFKYTTTLALTTLFRFDAKISIPEFMDLMKAHINKNIISAKWLLWQFCNTKVIFEFLLECHSSDMRRLVVGLLYCAMLKVYEEEKIRLNNPSENDILINFVNGILYQIPFCRKYTINFEQYFQVLSRLTSLGPEIRDYFFKINALKRLLGFWGNLKTINWSSFDDLPFKPNDNPELGLPSEVDDRFQSLFEKYYSAKQDKENQNAEPLYTYLVESISFLLRSVIFEKTNTISSFALPECKEIDSDTKKLFTSENIGKLMCSSGSYISITSLLKAYKHLSWECTEFKTLLLRSIITMIKQGDNNDIITSLYFFKGLISADDSEQSSFVPIALIEFNQMMKASPWSRPVAHYFTKYMLEFAKEIPIANDWYCKNIAQWNWILDWLKYSNSSHLGIIKETNKTHLNELVHHPEFEAQQIKENLELLKEGNIHRHYREN